MEKNVVIRVKVNNNFQFIILDEHSLSLDNFMNASMIFISIFLTAHVTYTIPPVYSKFGIAGDLKLSIALYDNHHTPIPANQFDVIARNYSNSGSFYIIVEYDVMQQNVPCVTVEVNYLISVLSNLNNCNSIL